MNCLLCNRNLQQTITLKELLSLQPYHQQTLCSRCMGKFSRIHPEQACPGCSRVQAGTEYCNDCQKWLAKYDSQLIQHQAFFQYDETLKDWLHQFKFQGDIRLAQIFINQMKDFYRHHQDCRFVPLPVSNKSKMERGFNQCELLLQAAQIPYVNILTNLSASKKQSEKNRKERMQTEQPFSFNEEVCLSDGPIVIFDDIYTTGRTMLHAKELLWSKGLRQLKSLTIGR